MLTLDIEPRKTSDSPVALRTKGVVPAVFYGPKEGSTPIAVDSRKLEHVWKAGGQTSVITLEGVGDKKESLIHDVQFHPVTGRLLHADFYVLEKGKKIKINVPLEWVGQAPAEKAGHIVVKALHEVEIEVAPAELPHNLAVDLSKLENVGDHITASQITLPPSAALITDAHEIVVSVTEFKEEAVEITPAPETVITTAKTEEGAPAAEGATGAPEEKKAEKPASGGKGK